ncbi:hypothetical protein DPMN_038135, partial [Dreissena polymorpha]
MEKRFLSNNEICIQRTVQEVRAGPTYSSNIEDQDVDVTTIPPPIPKPGPAGLDTTGKEFVFFDLETKGLEHTSHIIQIAAVHSTGQKISLQASEITGVTVVSDSMLVKRQTTNYRLVIRAELAGNESFLAIANITVGSDCQNDTMRKNSFACGDGTCVPLEVVCNLHPDCDDMSDETICEHLPHQSMCTFDKGMCGWWDLPSDQFEHFDWTRHKGPSSTKGTGPPFDHTNGTLEGYYMYIESSKWNMLDQATLESPVFPSVPKNTNSRCMFRFYYHMMGRTVGELTIKLLDLCSPQVHNRIPTCVWHKEGQQGKSWLYAEVPITNMTSRYAVHISGTGGFQNQGDIAIDDLSLSAGCF